MTKLAKLKMEADPLFVGAMAYYEQTEALKKKFTVKSRFGDTIELFKIIGYNNKIAVPRAVCPEPAWEGDLRTEGEEINFINKVVPRNTEQARVIKSSVDLLLAGKSFIFEAPTGFGKTVCASSIIAQVGRPTLIVVPKTDLLKYWKKELPKWLGIDPSDVGTIQGDVFDVIGKKVVVGMLHSLAKEGRYPTWVRKSFGLIVFDEVHRLGAETFSEVCTLFAAKLRLGLSATPDRDDGKEIVFKAHIGPVKVRTKAIPLVPKVLRYVSPWQCPLVPRTDKETGKTKFIKMPHQPGKLGHMIKLLARDPLRNKLLVRLIAAAYRKDRKIVFFSDSLEHIDQIEAMLRKAKVRGYDIARYIGGMSDAELDRASGKQVILATFQMMSEGTNIPWLNVAVLGSPRAKVKQIVGRILREYPDKPQPVVFDVLDNDSHVFKGYTRKRLEWYREIGAKIIDMT